MALTPQQAGHFATLALRGIHREYPNKLDHVLNGPGDLRSPRDLHPAFYGCFDWHSAVHGHWMLVRLLKVVAGWDGAPAVRQALAQSLTRDNLQAELDYLGGPGRRSFERTYGWAWLLKLAQELTSWDDPQGQEWARNIEPLAAAFVQRYLQFLPTQTYPIRAGTHPNTAFGLAFAFDYAQATSNRELSGLVAERALHYYENDEAYNALYEPGGSDFLSPCLAEADLMRRVMSDYHFPIWFHRFLPLAQFGLPETIFTPAYVADRSDPQLVHLDGLNLSRAWCMQGIASALPEDDPAREILSESARAHAEAGLPHVASGDYMGEHWLASFAVYMLSGQG